jgi:hypothetical protein
MSSPFHSGMNHWPQQWFNDRLHKKDTRETEAPYTYKPVGGPKGAGARLGLARTTFIAKMHKLGMTGSRAERESSSSSWKSA